MWAPCPFHQEKTASFHVDDKQGFYYCFGCHAKGDAITFVRETENVGFMEAVEILARETGMTVPARDPKAQEKADLRTGLSEVMEQAVQFYRMQLKTAAGTAARDYLQGRGLDDAAWGRWNIGYAPDDRQVLWGHLTGKGIAPELIIDAGLAAKPDDGGAPYDRFRGRIIFPIRDGRGRCTALGGRAMAENARAKYLNSPETALFDKGRSLYNQAPAREAAGKGQSLVVAEGYMDVIALAEAGFGAAVAPLGTAVTEDQLRLLWRIDPEPIVALDGDTAGVRAAMRLVDLALPLLEAGQSLRFAVMPEGQDPDDILRSAGAGAMAKLLDGAVPMVRLLWRRETEGKVFDSPERKAALDKSLRDALRRIGDKSIRAHYGEEIRTLRQELFAAGRPQQSGNRNWIPGRKKPDLPPKPGTKASFLASGTGSNDQDFLRRAVILATLMVNPEIAERFEADLETMHPPSVEHDAIRRAILAALGGEPGVFYQSVEDVCGAEALEKLFSLNHVKISPDVRVPGNAETAVLCVTQEFAKLTTKQGAEREINEAVQDLGDVPDEGITWRLGQAAAARNDAERSQTEDRTEYELSESGAQISRDERRSFEKLLDSIQYTKGTKRPQ